MGVASVALVYAPRPPLVRPADRARRRRAAGVHAGRRADVQVQQPGRDARALHGRRGVHDGARRRRRRHEAGTWWLVAAGALVGLGFLTKQLQALLVVPALALVYLVGGADDAAAPDRSTSLAAGRRDPRLGRLVRAAGPALARVLAALHRRLDGQLAARARPRLQRPRPHPRRRGQRRWRRWPAAGRRAAPGGARRRRGTRWLPRRRGRSRWRVPAAGPAGPRRVRPRGRRLRWHAEPVADAHLGVRRQRLVAAAGRHRRADRRVCGSPPPRTRGLRPSVPRTDRPRALLLLGGAWMLVHAIVFSAMSGTIHPYYTVAMVPGRRDHRRRGRLDPLARARAPAARIVLAVTVVGTAAWSAVVLTQADWGLWLRWVVIVAGVLGAVGLLLPRLLARRAVAVVVAVLALVGTVGASTAYAAVTAATPHSGSIVTAGPNTGMGGPGGGAAGQGRAARARPCPRGPGRRRARRGRHGRTGFRAGLTAAGRAPEGGGHPLGGRDDRRDEPGRPPARLRGAGHADRRFHGQRPGPDPRAVPGGRRHGPGPLLHRGRRSRRGWAAPAVGRHARLPGAAPARGRWHGRSDEPRHLRRDHLLGDQPLHEDRGRWPHRLRPEPSAALRAVRAGAAMSDSLGTSPRRRARTRGEDPQTALRSIQERGAPSVT